MERENGNRREERRKRQQTSNKQSICHTKNTTTELNIYNNIY